MFNIKPNTSKYVQISDSDSLDEIQETSPKAWRKTRWAMITILVALACFTSFLAGSLTADHRRLETQIEDVILSIPVSAQKRQHVVKQPEMETAPPADGSPEPAWDALCPNGLGYIQHPTLAPELSVVGVFHQLHCLYAVRRAYYAAYASSVGLDFDPIGVRSPEHIAHCFDYLQQALICAADTSIEPFEQANFHHTDFSRKCRDYEQVRAWAEEWRVLNGRGFLLDFRRNRDMNLNNTE